MRCVRSSLAWLVLCGSVSLLPAADMPLSPADSAAKMTLPTGFRVSLFAAEPDVVQPIAFAIDDRGRLWVIECLSYPQWETGGRAGRDRVVIFEDTDGDGRFDSRKVFWDRGTNLSGIALGFGGVWLCATPNFLFVPDRDGDDVPDGPPRVLLDGWDLKARHNVFNALTWGPDGWLYGCNGILSNSTVGKPLTPAAERVAFNCGVWRYHPTRHVFEVVAWGTTNPWGLDFDQHGQMFITNCVIKHLFHVVPGAHFKRMFGQDLNPHVYGLLESCADHIHWGGGNWQDSRGGTGKHDKPGGGHAHAGCMVYLGDNWPDRYRNRVFTVNIHGRRLNNDRLVRKGSGYVARHGVDLLKAADPWFRGLELKTGPDGGVYMTDWSDTGECHDNENTRKTTGRIFKITFGAPRPARVDLGGLADQELLALHGHKNEWYVRHARRLLAERAAAGKLTAQVRSQLRQQALDTSAEVVPRLRAMWTLHALGAGQVPVDASLFADRHDIVRGWAVRLEVDDRKIDDKVLEKLVVLARTDVSPRVRLELASALQRLPVERRWALAAALVTHAEDAGDASIPLMLWYGIEPLAAVDRDRALKLVVTAKIPLIREYLARRIASLKN